MSVEVLMAESDIMDSHNEESAIYKCKHCDNTFMKSKALKKHMKKSHFRVESVEDENELVLQKNKVKFECKYCDNTFKKERNLNLHIREDHEDEDLDDESVKFDIKVAKVQKKSYECPVCGIDYHIESELKRHMELRHAGENSEDANKEEASLEETEKLLTQDDETFMMEDNGSLDEAVDSPFDVVGDNQQDNVEVELHGESLSMEDIDFDFDATSENDSSYNVAESNPEELPDEIEDASMEVNQPVDNILEESGEFEFPVEQSVEDYVHQDESVEVELPVDDVMADNSMEFELDGESIVMDDAAFDMLESAMQMTMSTPDDSDEEENVPLSNRKRKSKGKSQKKKRGRPSKESKDDGEILLDGEAVVEDLDTSATDDDDIVVVDEVNIVQNEESVSEDSESEDDDPDFNPSSSFIKKEQPKRNLRPKRTETRTKKAVSTAAPIQITPMVKKKVLGRGRTRISVVPEASSVPIINSIPRSTRIVFNPGKSNTDGVDELAMKRSNEVKNLNLSSKKLLCSLCKNVFLTRDKFNVHMVRDHRKPLPSNTPQSSKKRNSNTVEQMECLKCDGTFSKKTLLDDHIKSTHSHKCTKCRQKFDSKDTLQQHMKNHLVKCDKCNFAGESKQKVIDHKKAEHNFKCSKCRQAFDSTDKLDSHVKANHLFKCGKCNVIFDAKNLMDEHNKKLHYFPCSSCDKVFDMRQRLMTHDKTSHQSCDVCEDDFSWAEPGHSCYYTKNNIKPVVK